MIILSPRMNQGEESYHSSAGNTRRLLREEGIGLTPQCAARGGKPAAREKRSVFPERPFGVSPYP